MSEKTTTTTPTTCCPTTDKKTATPSQVRFQRPKYRVESNEEAHVLSVAMPGVGKESVDVSLDGDELTVTGTRGHEVDKTWKTVFSELDSDDYKLRVRLNVNLDTEKIKAVVEHGLLTLTLPIREEAKPRAIAIS